MSGFSLSGIVPPVVTPLTPDQQLDVASLRKVIDNQIEAGVDALFALGSTGEVAYFDDDQRLQIVEKVVELVAGRVPVLVGCIENTWRRVVQQAKLLSIPGVCALVATSPIYAINSDQEIADHFRAIADHVDLPLLAYNVPVRTHAKLSNDVLLSLGEEGVLVGVKDSSGDDVSFRRLAIANRERGIGLKLFTGHEVVCDGQLLSGADGIVPGLANVDPAGYVQLWRASQAGDWAGAKAAQDKLAKLMEIAFQAPGRSGDAAGVGGFKTAMAYLGILETATMAHPVQVLSKESVARVHKVVDEWKAL